MSNKQQYYEPFGPEWAKEMNKLPKKLIIEMFSKKGIECDNHIDARAKAIEQNINLKENIEEIVDSIKQIEHIIINYSSSDVHKDISNIINKLLKK